MTKSNTSPAESLKTHSTIRKLSFDESIEFEKSTDDSEDFQVDYDNLIKCKIQSEGQASIPCFKKIGFHLCTDKEELFIAGLHNKAVSCPNFSMEAESYEDEQSLKLLPSHEEVTMEEERPESQNIVIDVFMRDNMYELANRRRCDSFQIDLEERSEQVQSTEQQATNEFGPDMVVPDVPCLPTCTNLRDPDLWTISSQTLANLISEGKRRYLIIDCRYDYEYKGGHVQGAINIDSHEILERLFLTNRHHLNNDDALDKIKEDLEEFFTNSHHIGSDEACEPPILIFHCEFSQKRGPRALRALRGLDRQLNVHRWPYLYYPQMYILEEGYQSFQGLFPDYCNPRNSYIRMLDKNFREEYACAKEKERRTWKKTCSVRPTADLKSWTQRSRTITYY